MQDHALGVGEELVLEGGIRLTVLAVKEDRVVLGLTAAEPVGVRGPEVRQRRPRRTATPVPVPGEN